MIGPVTKTRISDPGGRIPILAPSVWGWLFGGFFLLYALTGSGGPDWQDPGFQLLRMVQGQLDHELGLALIHPLQHWLGRFFIFILPFEPARSASLLSGFAAAIAVANVYATIRLLTGREGAAILAACGLGLAHTFWAMATRVESYTLVAALLSAECWMLAAYFRSRRPAPLLAAFFFGGLGIANHNLGALTFPILLLVLFFARQRGVVGWRGVLAALGIWLVGTLPYSLIVLSAWIQSGDLVGTIQSALFGTGWQGDVLNASLTGHVLMVSALFTLLSFPNLMLPAALNGLLRGAQSRAPAPALWALGGSLAIHFIFVVRYSIVDQHTFFLPTYTLLAIFAGVGVAALGRWGREKQYRRMLGLLLISLILTPVVYLAAIPVARAVGVLDAYGYDKPYRDDYRYLFMPWGAFERSAERMSNAAADLAGRDGWIVVEDGMAAFAVRYRMFMRYGDDSRVVPSSEDVVAEILAQMPAGPGNVGAVMSDTDRLGIEVPEAELPGADLPGVELPGVVVLVPMSRANPRTPVPEGLAWSRVGDLYRLVPEFGGEPAGE